MKLLKLILRGFKCYAETTIFGPFSESRNCIVGLNGSGKSSFFDSIEFLLLKEYSILSPHNRHLFINNRSKTQTAFIELIFDNKDRSMPVDNDEIAIRRSFSLKKDDYFINGLHSSRYEVENLFQAQNISLNQGLFIIKQGKVKAIAEMSDSERLSMIQECAGIQSYEIQRQESLILLANAQKRTEKIKNCIDYIENRLNQLEAEMRELKELEELENLKKAIAIIIYERKKKSLEQDKSFNEDEKIKESSVIDSLRNQIEVNDEYQKELISQKEKIEDDIELISKEINEKEKEKSDCIKIQTKLSFELRKSNIIELPKIQEILSDLNDQLVNYENEKKIIYEKLTNEQNRLHEISLKLSETTNLQEIQFQFQKLSKDINSSKQLLENLQNKLTELKNLNYEEELTNLKINKTNILTEIQNQKQNLIMLMNERKKLWFDQASLSKKLQRLSQYSISLNKKFDKFIGKTLSNAYKILQVANIDGYYGLLIDLIKFPETLINAIESTTKRYLFMFVVESFDVIKEIEKHVELKGLNFLLKSSLHYNKYNIDETDDLKKLINFLEFNEEFRSVIEFVFDRVFLCPTLEIAYSFSNSNKIDCVCLTGDFVSKKGVITGGSRNKKYSVITFYQSYREIITDEQNLEQQIKNIKIKIEEIEENLSKSSEEIKINEQEFKNISSKKKEINFEIQERYNETLDLEAQISEEKFEINQLEKELQIITQQREMILSEKLSLSLFEINQLKNEQYNLQVSAFSNEILLKSIDKKLKSTKDEIRKYEKTQKYLLKLQSPHELEIIKKKLNEAEKKNNEITQQLEKLYQDQHLNSQSHTEIEFKLQQAINEKEYTLKKLDNQQNELERIIRKGIHISNRLEEVSKSIDQFGYISFNDLLENRRYEDYKDLVIELNSIDQKIQQYENVNRKASDQYLKFKNQRENLRNALPVLEKNEESIINLIA
jgi:structural maintenance of chromosome 3 (chondroitin sulfate proteoglycan 6)